MKITPAPIVAVDAGTIARLWFDEGEPAYGIEPMWALTVEYADAECEEYTRFWS